MYCINCGVKLADTEKQCPLCGVSVFHPDIDRPESRPLYPPEVYPHQHVSSKAAAIVLSTLFLIPIFITLACDMTMNGRVTWSGYVIGAIAMCYVALVLPMWFRSPNPVIFVPCGFAALALYVLYLNYALQGKWFLTFAFPVIGGVGLIVTAVVTLTRYLRGGRLYIYGGAFIAMGLFMPLVEFLMMITFPIPHTIYWSIYPLIALVLLGGMLIVLAIYRPARELMEQKFFL